MKRIGNCWDKFISDETILRAIQEGTKNKRNKREVQFLLYSKEAIAKDPTKEGMIDPAKAMEYGEHIKSLLESGEWEPKEPRYKRRFCTNRTANGGKWRDLYVPCLTDHIIAHMAMIATEEAFLRGMHPHCCGSVPKRGINYLRKTCERWFKSDKECRYYVKLDIRHFFDNIKAERLVLMLEKKIKCKRLLDIHRKIIRSGPVACPVGYYTSPWYSNLYLQDMDWFIDQQLYKERRGKRIKLVKHSIRYADDILLMGTSRNDLRKSVKAIERYLDGLGLRLKPTWEIKAIGVHDACEWKLKRGTYWCDIGGYRFCRNSTTIRPGIFISASRLARRMYKRGKYTYKQCQSMQARIGWAVHADSCSFFMHYIYPYVNFKAIRRVISDVDKERKRGRQSA